MNTRLFMRGVAPQGRSGLRVEHHVHAVEHLATVLALDVQHALHAEDVLAARLEQIVEPLVELGADRAAADR